MRSFCRFALIGVAFAQAARAGEWEITRPAVQFDRCQFAGADQQGRVKAVGNLSGWKDKWNPVSGWVEYDVEVPQAGWYEWIVPADLWGMEYSVDGKLLPGCHGGRKISNLWLEAGKHVFRIQRWGWTGYDAKLDQWFLRASTPEVGKTVRLLLADGRGIVRAGEEAKLVIQGGGRAAAVKVTARLLDPRTREVLSTKEIELPANAKPQDLAAPLACPREGVFEISLAEGDKPLAHQVLPPLQVIVVDTKAPARGGELKKTLLSEIDCVATEPAYAGDGGSRIVEGKPGRYREGGSTGFLFAQHHGQDSSWFAYKLAVPEAQKPYILETDHPDDAFRTFCIAIREAATDAYPVAGGMDTGGCYSLSNTMQTHTILFWPKTTDLRVVFVTAHNGRPGAAAAKIRLYRVDGEIPLLDVPVTGGRAFANWYEEGDNFLATYGAPNRNADGILIGADRWARSIACMGGDTLAATVSVYQMAMYPSNYNTAFCSSGTLDQVRILLLKAEKHGMGLVGEFHPECRELDWLWNPTFAKRPQDNLLVNKDGCARKKFDETPRFHPLHPVDQEWYLGMIGEFADRYKDSPAFRGVSLRLMSWANPALNNFHSLDWGYDDLTVGMFEKETGVSTGVKADDPKRFQVRYQWLMANAKEKWIAWRCEKIADLHRRIVTRVRQARPDLRVYLTLFGMGASSSMVGAGSRADREAGLDPERLGAIDGLVLVNCRYPYGRQAWTYEGPFADQRRRDNLLDPELLLSLRGPSGAAFMAGSAYFEATEVVVTPEALGFPKGTKRTWMSGVVNPAGRHFLERYAVQLAEADALYVADGGNAYTMGQPILQEFMREYRNLPPVPFTSRADARDPVAVRELARKDDFLFYAVNAERYPVQVAIELKGAGPVKRFATGEEVPLKDGRLALELKPYQLLAFKAPAGAAIARVATTIPAEERKYAESLFNAVATLNQDVEAGKVTLDGAAKKLLAQTVEEAQIGLKEGRVWRTRTMLENSQLAEKVYTKAQTFPPGLEYLADPQVLTAIKARGLTKAKDAALSLKFDQVDGGKTPVTGKLAKLEAVLEGGAEIQDGHNGGKALHFNGQDARVVVKGDGLTPKDLTVSFWAKPENVGGRRGLFLRPGCEIFFWNGSLAVEGGDKSGRTTCRTGDGVYGNNKWYHFAVTLDSGKAITLYVNGVEEKKVPFPQSVDSAAGDLLLGWNGWGGAQNNPAPGWFAGKLSDVKVFDRALSPDEVLAEWGGKE